MQSSWQPLQSEFDGILREGKRANRSAICERSFYHDWDADRGYHERIGQHFVKFNVGQTIVGTFYVAPNSALDRDLIDELSSATLPHTTDLLDRVSTAIEERCLQYLLEKRTTLLALRQNLGHLHAYDSEPHAETDSLYNITEEAYNLLVDHIFLQRESSAKDARESAVARKALAPEVDIALRVLIEGTPHAESPAYPLTHLSFEWRLYCRVLQILREHKGSAASWQRFTQRIVQSDVEGLDPFLAERVAMAPRQLWAEHVAEAPTGDDAANGTSREAQSSDGDESDEIAKEPRAMPPQHWPNPRSDASDAWIIEPMNADEHVVVRTLLRLAAPERTARAEQVRGYGWEKLSLEEFMHVVDGGTEETEREWRTTSFSALEAQDRLARERGDASRGGKARDEHGRVGEQRVWPRARLDAAEEATRSANGVGHWAWRWVSIGIV